MQAKWGPVNWRLPDWVEPFVDGWTADFDSPSARMRFAAALAMENIRQGTGGPFGAAVFDDRERLIAPGVNLVTEIGVSAAHAEIVALGMAQQRVGSFDLSAGGAFELVTSVEPCAMCLGAIPWSGVARVVCGASGAEAEAIGFDEGAKPRDWRDALAGRGIEVKTGIEAATCQAVLKAYRQAGGLIYNPGGGPETGGRFD